MGAADSTIHASPKQVSRHIEGGCCGLRVFLTYVPTLPYPLCHSAIWVWRHHCEKLSQ